MLLFLKNRENKLWSELDSVTLKIQCASGMLIVCKPPKKYLGFYRRAMSNANKTYSEAVKVLNTLVSNETVINEWKNTRMIDKSVSLANEMKSYLSRVGVDLPTLSKKAIHVAGTKGKGSTCALVESIIRHHGYTTGLYTSPHLIVVRERIKLNGIPISEVKFATYFWHCYDTLQATRSSEFPSMPVYFRFLTVMAFKVFQEENVDCPVIEVGIGGRTDCTNVLDFPAACGITSLGYDHMDVLGNTLSEIAFEKTGIFKKGIPAVSVRQFPECQPTVIKRAKELQVGEFYIIQPFDSYAQLTGYNATTQHSLLSLEGSYQHINASLAIALSDLWLRWKLGKGVPQPEVSENLPIYPKFPLTKEVQQGLKTCEWPGRSQKN